MTKPGWHAANAPHKTRTVIASKAMALAIVERIAKKHQMTVAAALCVRRDRFSVACRAEIAWTLKDELDWAQRPTGKLLGITQPAVRKLLGYHEMSLRRSNNVLPAETIKALAVISGDDLRRRLAEAESRAAYLQGELDRLTGASITHRLAESFGLNNKLRCALVLGILAEAYPRAVSPPDLVELYDEACERLNYGARRGASFNLITKNIAALRESFLELGYPDPVVSSEGSSGMQRRLTDEAAVLLHEAVGAPRLSALKIEPKGMAA